MIKTAPNTLLSIKKKQASTARILAQLLVEDIITMAEFKFCIGLRWLHAMLRHTRATTENLFSHFSSTGKLNVSLLKG